MQNRRAAAASAVYILVGTAGLLGSAVVLLLFMNNTIYSIPVVGPLFEGTIGQTLYLGILVVIASVLHLVAGFLMWKGKKGGAYLGLALSASEALGYLAIFAYPQLAIPLVASLGLGSALCILVAWSWDV